jgi:hypothetical protein
MPKSNGRTSFGRGSGTVTVIDEPVRRSYAQKAQIVFWVTLVVVGLLSAVVLASKLEPILALIAGVIIGLVVAGILASITAAWPVIRTIWWWLPELAAASGLLIGWFELASHTGLILRLIIVVAITGITAGIRPVRRLLSAVTWCLISRHRIRTCFSEFIITNRNGSLPLVLAARPTPAGERLWIWLRPGLSLPDVQDRADKIAAACWATSVIADTGSASNSALVRIDIKRRDPLTGRILSPLMAMTGGIIPRRSDTIPPVGLDLTDITSADVTAIKPGKNTDRAPRLQWPNQPSTTTAPRDSDDASDDNVSDWI